MDCLSWLYYAGVGALAQWRKFTGHMSPLHSALFQLTLLALLAGNIISGVLNYRRMLDARAHPVSSLRVERPCSWRCTLISRLCIDLVEVLCVCAVQSPAYPVGIAMTHITENMKFHQ